jgi:hypothetical protein
MWGNFFPKTVTFIRKNKKQFGGIRKAAENLAQALCILDK